MEEEELRRLAEELRDQLATVIADDAERAQAGAELADALRQPPGEAKERLRRALRARAETRAWMRRRSGEVEDPDRAIGPLGDVAGDVLGVLFVCPQKDFSVVRETVSDTVERCPNDGSVLVRLDW